MLTIVIATRNRHKVEELRELLGGACAFRTLADYPEAPTVVEDAATFAGNARKKSETLARWLGGRTGAGSGPGSVEADTDAEADEDAPLAVLADDSGLEVDALGGAPGVHSARFAGGAEAGNSPDAANNAKLLGLLADVPVERRTARFRCVLAFTRVPGGALPEGPLETHLFEGACEGRIGGEARGAAGFGYDPLFVPRGGEQTFAELGAETKNRLSHRARALERLREWLSA